MYTSDNWAIIGADHGLSHNRRQAIILSQCCHIFNWTQRNKLKWNLDQIQPFLFAKKLSKTSSAKMAAILSWPQRVNKRFTLGVSLSCVFGDHSGGYNVHPTGNTIWRYDDVIKWKYFPRYWLFVKGIRRSPVDSPQKASDADLWCFFICACTNSWTNDRDADDLSRHYDITVMVCSI